MTLPRVQPIAPTWRKEPFDHPDWLFDLKPDGFRALCYVEHGGCTFVSRRGNVFTRFDTLYEQIASTICPDIVAELGVEDAILDGEVVTADETGRPQSVSIMEFRDGKVARETQYFADAFEAGPSRAQWVEPMR